MALFGRNREESEVATPPAEDGWSIVQAERDGAPMLLRFNGEASAGGRSELPVRFGIAVRCRDARRNGFPGDGDMEPLERIEEAIVNALPGEGVLAAVVTTGGMREFVGYVRGREPVEPIWQAARAAAPGYDIRAYGKSDPEWEGYAELDPASWTSA